MNNDLISRSALKKRFKDTNEAMFSLKRVRYIIDNAPAVEPLERIGSICDENCGYHRPKGEWIVTSEDNNGVHRICCPFCSYEKGSNNTDLIIVTFTNFPKFCENCGADMRGAE